MNVEIVNTEDSLNNIRNLVPLMYSRDREKKGGGGQKHDHDLNPSVPNSSEHAKSAQN